MSLLVVGSMAFDSIQTPSELRERVMGGSAVYSSYAASYFTPVQLVGIVGNDWPAEHMQLLHGRNIDTTGVQHIAEGKTFYWKGRYAQNMNHRESLETDLNVYGTFDPLIPPPFAAPDYLLLANAHPSVQLRVLEQIARPKFILSDTMDLWIQTGHRELLTLLQRIDGIILNDSEARLLTEKENVIDAGRTIQRLGPKYVIIKKGEHGAMFFAPEGIASLPAFPTDRVIDPTGAGDAFAGGMIGYIASVGKTDNLSLRRALAYGTLVASFSVEDFSLDQLRRIERPQIEERMAAFQAMLRLE